VTIEGGIHIIHISISNEDKTVGRLSEAVALAAGVRPAEARRIKIAATLHDIGKQRLPSGLLDKPGKLEAHEFEQVKAHTKLGAEMLADMRGRIKDMAVASCLYHHEWADGSGYWGKRIDDLPYYVQYVAISDVFTALITERAYKRVWSPEEAADYIAGKAGTQFSHRLAGRFLSLVSDRSRASAIFGWARDSKDGKLPNRITEQRTAEFLQPYPSAARAC